MDCRELEERFEALLDGALDERHRQRCARHLESCPRCRELAEPLAAAATPPEELLGAVLASTSGSPCGRAESLLGAWQDGELTGTDRELLAAHLGLCGGCRALAAAMTRLTAELPRLAELPPEPGFAETVLAATLPIRVRLRRWWAAVWPQWVRRPRFASEAAFIATLVLVLVFATPGSPLEAVPSRALTLAQTDPAARLEAPVSVLEEGITSRVISPLAAFYARGESTARGWAGLAAAQGEALSDEVATLWGTSRERLASLLESAETVDSDTEEAAENPDQETP